MEFQRIIQEYHPMIYKICRVYSDDFDFEDLYQEVLVSIWSGMKRFREDAKLSTWIYRVALNTALTYQRNTSKSKGHQPLMDYHIPVDDESESTGKEEQVQMLFKAMSQLDKVDRSVMLLYLEEKKYEEIAEITGLSVSHVGVKINRAKSQLKKILNAER